MRVSSSGLFRKMLPGAELGNEQFEIITHELIGLTEEFKDKEYSDLRRIIYEI